MSDIVLSQDTCVLPPVRPGDKPIVCDMRRVNRARSRLFELASLTTAKAGELLATFIEAWGDARRYATTAQREFSRAKQRLREVRATVVLDKAPDELKRRGLASTRSPAGSEDLRDGVVNSDPDYQRAADLVAYAEALAQYLGDIAEELKMAYFTANKLVDPRGDARRETSGGTGDDEPGALTETERAEAFVRKHSNQNNYKGAFGAPKL